ncbi:uncharacterized protein LOC115212069 isoform X1 [Octopus sinensis]|uniref:Uncharacterized protein LOC115212069 isoform X1 n=1 Tax=Octopus sinensis TaxID=2607531 RepID=A0A7E6EVD6_9MOLL|nr:uncharacterized protein LOC115212069 isoform X1 [Octopus sinensis]
MTGKSKREHFWRVSKILVRKLNAWNIISAINSHAAAVVRNDAGKLKWTEEKLKELDRKSRKVLSMYGTNHPCAGIDSRYTKRATGRKGWTKSFAFRLILKSFNEYKKPAENISRAMEHKFLTVTGKFRVEYPGVQSQLRRNISQVLNKFQALLNMNLLDESSSTGNGTEDRTAETNF